MCDSTLSKLLFVRLLKIIIPLVKIAFLNDADVMTRLCNFLVSTQSEENANGRLTSPKNLARCI